MRRSKVMRQIVLLTAVASLLCTVSAQAKKPDSTGGGGGGGEKGPSFQIIKLDTDGGASGVLEGLAFDINDSRLIVGSASALGAYWTVTEVDGELESHLHFLDNSAFTYSIAAGCNEWGEIVGSADNGLAAVYWASTTSAAVELPAPLTRRGTTSINDSGVIAGWSRLGLEKRALVWSFTGGQWQYLELAPLGNPEEDEEGNILPDYAVALAVSDADTETGVMTVVGESNGNAVNWTVMLDNDGGLVAGPSMILDVGEATGLNNVGTVCGWAFVGPHSGGDGVVWQNGGMAEPLDLYTEPSWTGTQAVWPRDVNDKGLIVGQSLQAVVWPHKDAALIKLRDFLPRRNSPITGLASAEAVNEANEIVGYGSDPEGRSVPYLAVPE